MALIGLSGKKQSGKNLTCLIIQYLIFCEKTTGKADWSFQKLLDTFDTVIHSSAPSTDEVSGWQTKLFGGKLKDIVCLLIGCTKEQLESNDFKEKPLGEEWWCYKYHVTSLGGRGHELRMCNSVVSYPDERANNSYQEYIGKENKSVSLVKTTPRMLLQLIGTDAGRKLIHPDIWVNSLFADYKGLVGTIKRKTEGIREMEGFKPTRYWNTGEQPNVPKEYWNKRIATKFFEWEELIETPQYPNWIITDVRFENEVQAIKDRDGIVFRIERDGLVSTDDHESETALDNYTGFNSTILNNGSIENLIETVKRTLQIHEII